MEYFVKINDVKELNNYEISNLGSIRKLTKKGVYAFPPDICKIIDRTLNKEVIFEVHYLKDTIRRKVADTLIYSFLGLDLQKSEYKVEFIDDDYTNITASNISITSRNFRDIYKRRIQKACEFSYKNSVDFTPYENIFITRLVSVLSSYELPKVIINDVPVHYIENFNRKFYKLINMRYRSFCIPQKVLFSSNSFYIIDFFIPSLNVGFEIDGLHHYFNDDQLSYDKSRDNELMQRYNVNIIRIRNPDLDRESIEFIVGIIDQLYREQLINHLSKKLSKLIDNSTIKFNMNGGSYYWNKIKKYSAINL